MRGTIGSWLIFTPLSLLLAVGACGSDPSADDTNSEPVLGTRIVVEDGAYTNVTPSELKSMLDDKDFPIVNVHTPYDGEIEGTDSFIAFDQIDEHVDRLPVDPASRIFLYCRSGSMSATAAESLVSLGYTDVWNLDGGMIAWEAAGYELIHDESAGG
jgi:rhodanese-related sulfurtransferase